LQARGKRCARSLLQVRGYLARHLARAICGCVALHGLGFGAGLL
jgi:hypothetical protein